MKRYILALLGVVVATPPVAGDARPAVATVVVVTVDDRFEPDHVIFHSGQPTELLLENHGKDMHEFTAPEFLHAATIRDKQLLSNGGGDIVVQAGKIVRVRLIPGPVGDYKLSCADHDWDGMVGSIAVVK